MRLFRALAVLVLLWAIPASAQSPTITRDLSSGTCPGTGCVQLAVNGLSGVSIQVAGTFAGTLVFETSITSAFYGPLLMTPPAGGTPVTSTTTTGLWQGGVGGLGIVRVRFNPYSTGTATVTIQASSNGGMITSSGSITGDITVVGNHSNNNAAPGSDLVNTLTCLSGSTFLTYTTGRSEQPWCNLFGALAVVFTDPTTGAAYSLAPDIPSSTAIAVSECVILTTASTNATNCKASSGRFYGLQVINTTATVYYLRMYNLATGPDCSSATGFIRSIPIPSSTSGAGIVITLPYPVAYGTGIGYCVTSGSTSTNTGNAAAGLFGAILFL